MPNIPKSVIKQSHAIVREHPRMRLKRGGADSTKGVAKAIAWKHFCKEHPGSDHCHKTHEGTMRYEDIEEEGLREAVDSALAKKRSERGYFDSPRSAQRDYNRAERQLGKKLAKDTEGELEEASRPNFSSWNPILEDLAADLEKLEGRALVDALREAGETANQMAHGFFQKTSGNVFKQNAAADKAKGSATAVTRAHKSAAKVNTGASKELGAIAKQATKEKDRDTAKWAKQAGKYHDQRTSHHTGVVTGMSKAGAEPKPAGQGLSGLQARLQANKAKRASAPDPSAPSPKPAPAAPAPAPKAAASAPAAKPAAPALAQPGGAVAPKPAAPAPVAKPAPAAAPAPAAPAQQPQKRVRVAAE